MTIQESTTEPNEKPLKKVTKIIFPISIVIVIAIGSILFVSLFYTNQDGPDFKFEAGGYDSETISFSPPIENATIKIFLTNIGTAAAHNVFVEAEIQTTDNSEVLIDEVSIGKLDQNETKEIDFIFMNGTGIPFRAFIEGKITITSDEITMTLDAAG